MPGNKGFLVRCRLDAVEGAARRRLEAAGRKSMASNSPNFLEFLLDAQEELDPGGPLSASDVKLTFPLQDHAYGCVPEKVCQSWAPGSGQDLNDSDTEDLLQLLINPNDVYYSRSPLASPESDSGISDDPREDTPSQNEPLPLDLSPTVIYEVICDTGVAEEVTQPGGLHSSPLENWTPSPATSEVSIVGNAPFSFFVDPAQANLADISAAQDSFEHLHLQGLCLTEEERRLLSQEGILLQSDLPLSKAEERILKKVRRKIRNKQSAQDSRRRKKEYIDGLESRVAACSAQNQELRKKVRELETHNLSLARQLQTLHGLIKKTSSKAAQTSACLVILIFSLGLLILPNSTSLFSRTQLSRDDYKPSGVISRHILTEGGLPDPVESHPGSDLESPALQRERPREDPATGTKQQEAGSGFDLAKGQRLTNASVQETPGSGEDGAAGKAASPGPGKEAAKKMHADEM